VWLFRGRRVADQAIRAVTDSPVNHVGMAVVALAGRWARGRVRRPAPVETTYCAEVVAATYQAMGLLGDERPTNWYDPGSFWSGDELDLLAGARLTDEVAVGP